MYFNENEKRWEATQGYVFKRKDSEQVFDTWLYLGKHDSIENYEEVLKESEPEQGE